MEKVVVIFETLLFSFGDFFMEWAWFPMKYTVKKLKYMLTYSNLTFNNNNIYFPLLFLFYI